MDKKHLVSLDILANKINQIDKLKNKVHSVSYADYPKKYKIKFKNDEVVSFGHQDYPDFLYMLFNNYNLTHAKERRRLYRLRHDNEKDQSIYTPGFLSYHLLW